VRSRDGESVAVSGYPLQVASLVTTSGTLAPAWSSEIKNVQPPGAPRGSRFQIADGYLADVAVNPGNSRGPCSERLHYRRQDGPLQSLALCTSQY
jgi:hypothetical protein